MPTSALPRFGADDGRFLSLDLPAFALFASSRNIAEHLRMHDGPRRNSYRAAIRLGLERLCRLHSAAVPLATAELSPRSMGVANVAEKPRISSRLGRRCGFARICGKPLLCARPLVGASTIVASRRLREQYFAPPLGFVNRPTTHSTMQCGRRGGFQRAAATLQRCALADL